MDYYSKFIRNSQDSKRTIGGSLDIWYDKYLKYKEKYLALKNAKDLNLLENKEITSYGTPSVEKLKSKYNELENIMIGGTITIPTSEINNNKIKFIGQADNNDFIKYFNVNGDYKFSKINMEITQKDLQIIYDEKPNTIINNFYPPDVVLARNMFSREKYLLVRYKKIDRLILTDTYKIFILKVGDCNIYIKGTFDKFKTSEIEDNNLYIDTIDGSFLDIKIHNNDDIFSGLCKIINLEERKIKIVIYIKKFLGLQQLFNIKDFFIEYEINNMRDIENIFLRNEFNFQEFYDNKLKSLYICQESNILYKNICSSIINMLFLNNDIDKLTKLYNYSTLFGEIIKKILQIKTENIKKICKNSKERKMLLSNILKNINTIQTDMLQIKNYNQEWRDIPEEYRIVFDTGNESSTIIGKNVAVFLNKELRLPINETFSFTTTGVDTSIENKLNSYIKTSFKFKDDDETKNFNTDKEFNLLAYINEKTDPNLLLLGHESNGLKEFFQNGYCITYKTNKNDFTSIKTDNLTTIGMINLLINEIEELYIKIQITSTIKDNINKKIELLCLLINKFKPSYNDNQEEIDILYRRIKNMITCMQKDKIISDKNIQQIKENIKIM